MHESKCTKKTILINSVAVSGTQKVDNQKDVLSAHIDKVEILCLFFGEYHDNSFSVSLSNSEFKVINVYNKKDTIYVDYGENKNRLIKYVNYLYIDKTNKIVSKAKSGKERMETDYPFIRVIGGKGKTQVFKKDVRLRDDLEFTPVFRVLRIFRQLG